MIKEVEDNRVIYGFLVENRYQFLDGLADISNLKNYIDNFLHNGKVFMAFSEVGDPLGLIMGYMNDTCSKTAFVSILVTKEKYNGKGVGSSLLEFFDMQSRKSQMQQIRLTVLKKNINALYFYKNMKFRILEDRDNRFLLNKYIN